MSSSNVSGVAAICAVADLPSLPAVAYRSLAGYRWPGVRLAVAENLAVPAEVKRPLCRDRHAGVRTAALSTVRDATVLSATRTTRPMRAAAIGRNPFTAPSVLEELSHHPHPRVGRSLLLNPSTPSGAAERVARSHRLSDLFVTVPTSEMVAGMGMALSHHPYLASVWAGAPETLAVGVIARSPHLPTGAVGVLAARRGGGQWKTALALNPTVPTRLLNLSPSMRTHRERLDAFLAGRTAEAVCAGSTSDRLAAARFGSHTLDLLLGERPSFAEFTAMALRETDPISPDVLARAVEHLGPKAASFAVQVLAGTRVQAAASHSRVLRRHVERLPVSDDLTLAGEVSAALGSDQLLWDTFAVLSREWDGQLDMLLDSLGAL